MESDSDEETIEYDIEVVESSSCVSLDSDPEHELQANTLIGAHNQEASSISQSASNEPDISRSNLLAQAESVREGDFNERGQLDEHAEFEVTQEVVCLDSRTGQGKLNTDEYGEQWERSRTIVELPEDLASWSWDAGQGSRVDNVNDSAIQRFGTSASDLNEDDNRADDKFSEPDAQISVLIDERSPLSEPGITNDLNTIEDIIVAENLVASETEHSGAPPVLPEENSEPVEFAFEHTQWYECSTSGISLITDAADWLVSSELVSALQQLALLAQESDSCRRLSHVDPVELAAFEQKRESVLELQEDALAEVQVTEEDEDSDDLEREFDEEPAFEEQQVVLKLNCNARTQYSLCDELGRGKFGTVYRCINLASGRQFAAKFVMLRRSEDREDVQRELEIMSQLQHKRLLQLHDAFDDGANEMCLITELIEGGELFERIVDDDFELTEKKAAIFVRQICEGVDYMHSRAIVHLDMKPENILCVSKTGNRIKLIDFGLARRLEPEHQLRVMFGTPDFAAPEVLAYDTVSLATDMWSVGVICYVLLSGLSPFMGDTDIETMANVTRATYDFDDQAFEPISDLAKDFIARLLIREQRDRMQPSECLRHPWLARGGVQLEAAARDRRLSMTRVPHQLPLEVSYEITDTSLLPLSLDKKNLKKYVIRRKWHKTVHAIMALGRMGANLKLQHPQSNFAIG